MHRPCVYWFGIAVTAAALSPARSQGQSGVEVFDRQRPPASLSIRFEHGSVSVEGLTAAGRVFVYGVAARTIANSYTEWTRTAEVLADEEGDGSVSLALRDGVASLSFWLALDLDSGEAAFASPHPFPGHRDAISPGEVTVHGPDGRDRGPGLGLATKSLELLLVRPRRGTWTQEAFDGGENDAGGEVDGHVVLRLEDLVTPAGLLKQPAPTGIERGDLVLLVDTHTLRASLLVAKEAR